MFLADRAGVARAAARRPAIIGIAGDMAGAPLHVIDTRLERVYRAGIEAGFFTTRIARIGALHRRRQIQPLGEQQGAAVAVPQAIFRMDKNADR